MNYLWVIIHQGWVCIYLLKVYFYFWYWFNVNISHILYLCSGTSQFGRSEGLKVYKAVSLSMGVVVVVAGACERGAMK